MEFPAVERVIGDAEDPVYHLRYGVPLTIANLDPTFGSNSSVESDVAIHPTTSQEK